MIEIFADVWCPFAYVGIRKVFEYRDELGRGDVPVALAQQSRHFINFFLLTADDSFSKKPYL